MNLLNPLGALKEAWQQYADLNGAEYNGGNLLKGPKLTRKYKNWTMEMTVRSNSNENNVTYFETIVHVPFISTSDFDFEIMPEHVVNKILKKLGRKDIQVGIPEFDKAFMIRGNEPERVKAFFQDQALRDSIMKMGNSVVGIDEQKVLFHHKESQPVQALTFSGNGLANSQAALDYLFGMLDRIMDQLVAIGKASEAPLTADH